MVQVSAKVPSEKSRYKFETTNLHRSGRSSARSTRARTTPRQWPHLPRFTPPRDQLAAVKWCQKRKKYPLKSPSLSP